MFNSIKRKLIATYLLLLLVVISPLTMILPHYIEQFYLNLILEQLLEQGRIISAVVDPQEFITKDIKELNNKMANIGKGTTSRVTIIGKDGMVLADTDKNYRTMESHLNRPEVKEALKGKIGKETRHSRSLEKNLVYIALPVHKDREVVGVIRIGVLTTELQEVSSKVKEIIVITSVVMFLIGLIISIKIAQNLTNPIEKINSLAKKISEGKYDERTTVISNDEIGELGSTINRMATTIQSKIEDELHSKTRLQLILNNLDSGVIVFSSTGRVELANPATLKILNKSETELIDRHILELLRVPALIDKIKNVVKTGNKEDFQFTLEYPQYKYIHATIAPFSEGSKVNSIIGVFYDLTSVKEVEKIRIQFVANASHELQTPLTAVKGFTETLLDGAMANPVTLEKFLKIINKEANRLQKIIEALLKLSLLESEEHTFVFKQLDITKELNEIVSSMENKVKDASLHLKTGIPPRKIFITGDPDLLPQAFYNLLGNAIKYTSPGGSIIVSVLEELKSVKITIEDTGIGIPEQHLGRIFERFYRVDKARSREKGGTGLGLSIVKHIVEAHNGNIGVSSKPEKGTKFIIELPKN